MALQHKRSSIASKRPVATSLSDGQLAINVNASSPGVFFKNSSNVLTKVGPVHVGTSAPNSSPATGGSTGNSIGEQWLDTTGGTYSLKIWDGSAWRSESGTFVDVSGDTMTGALILPSGTASAPALGVGSSDNGLYLPATDELGISTNGSERIRIDSSGNLGVGTSAPTAKLNVVETVADNVTSALAASIGAKGTSVSVRQLNFYAPGPDSSRVAKIAIENTASPFAIDVNSAERMRIDSSGNVGIGTSSPQTITHILGANPVLRIQDSSTPIADAFAGIQLAETSSGESLGNYWQIALEGDSGTSTDHLTFKDKTSERMRIDSSGNVGIGTSSPQAPLQVNGTAIVGTPGQDNELLRFNTERPWSFWQRGSSAATSLDLASNGNKNFTISSQKTGDTSLTPSVFIAGSTGNVGIGTDDPRGQLTVKGNGTFYDTTLQLEGQLGAISKPAKIRMAGTNTTGGTSQISEIISYQPTGGGGSDAALGINVRKNGDAFADPNRVVTILGSGEVGIGTDSPQTNLQIKQDTDTSSSGIRLSRSNELASYTQWINTNSAYNIGYSNPATTDPSDSQFTITSQGKVGIGTETPSAKLHIANDQGGATGRILIDADVSSGYDTRIDATNTGLEFTAKSNSRGFVFNTGSTPSERMRIDSSGNVGIGTSSPAHKLDVTGNINLTGQLYQSMPADFWQQATTFIELNGMGNLTHMGSFETCLTSNGYRSNTQWKSYAINGYTGAAQIRLNPQGSITFGTESNKADGATHTVESRMHIDGSGNVGIGTSSPSMLLDVKGTVTAGGGSDEDLQQWNIGSDNVKSEIKYVDASASRGMLFGTSTGHTLGLQSNNIERIRLNDDGVNYIQNISAPTQLRIGTLDAISFEDREHTLVVYGHSTDDHTLLRGCNTADGTPVFDAKINGTRRIEIEADGDVYNVNNTYGQISDSKLKENIVDVNSQWDDIKALRVRNFNFREDLGYDSKTQIGFVAQEVEKVSPGLVKTNPDKDEEGNDLGTGTKVVKASVMNVKAFKALQEAMERIETLEQRLADAGIA